MTKQICVRNEIYRKLKRIKGEGSFSDLFEWLLNESGIVVPGANQSMQAPQPHQTNVGRGVHAR